MHTYIQLFRLHSLRGVGSVLGKTPALTCAAMLSDRHLVTGLLFLVGHDDSSDNSSANDNSNNSSTNDT